MKEIFNSVDFWIGQEVFLKTDTEQFQRIVTGICIRENIEYELSQGTVKTWHFSFEITTERDIIKSTSN